MAPGTLLTKAHSGMGRRGLDSATKNCLPTMVAPGTTHEQTHSAMSQEGGNKRAQLACTKRKATHESDRSEGWWKT